MVQNNYAAAKQHVSMGASVARYIPTNAQGWVDMLGSNDARAPEGGSAYIIGAGDDITGAIGIGMTGSYGGRDSVVTIYRPAYRGVPATSISFAQVDY